MLKFFWFSTLLINVTPVSSGFNSVNRVSFFSSSELGVSVLLQEIIRPNIRRLTVLYLSFIYCSFFNQKMGDITIHNLTSSSSPLMLTLQFFWRPHRLFSVFDISLSLHGQQSVLNNLCEATNLPSWVFISKLLTAINISLILYLLLFTVWVKKQCRPLR